MNLTKSVPAIVATMAPHPPGSSPGRIATYDRPNLGIMIHQGVVGGYVAMTPRRGLDYDRPAVLRIAGASWVQEQGGRWSPIADPLPRARLVSRAVASDEPGVATEGVDPATVAVVRVPLDLGRGEPGEASVVSDRPGRVLVATRSDTRQLLILSESIHEGWRLTIDGHEEPVVRVYGDFIGGAVGPGRHLAAFEFRPPSLRIGLAISAAGLLLLLLFMTVPLPIRTPTGETITP